MLSVGVEDQTDEGGRGRKGGRKVGMWLGGGTTKTKTKTI